MSLYTKDNGHWWTQTCDSCGGAFGCFPPDDPEAEVDWTCETCVKKNAQIKAFADALEHVRKASVNERVWNDATGKIDDMQAIVAKALKGVGRL